MATRGRRRRKVTPSRSSGRLSPASARAISSRASSPPSEAAPRSSARTADTSASPDCATTRSTTRRLSVAASPSPPSARRRAQISAPSRAASADQSFCRPSTWAASLGVKAARIARPRSSRRASGRARWWSDSSAPSGTGPWASASQTRASPLLRLLSAASRGRRRRTKRPSSASGAPRAAWRRKGSRTSGRSRTSRLSGRARRGPTTSTPASSSRTSLSPPMPTVCTAAASTMVRQPPTSAPSRSSAGKPSRSRAISVVVPPMSATRTSSAPARARAPMTLAAGPDRMVSIGRSSAASAVISEPSPLTTMSGASMPRSVSKPRTARISCWSSGIRRALRTVVMARRGASRLVVSSCAQVTGRPVSARTRSRSAASWDGLRTPK